MLILFAPGPPREKYFTELADIRSAGRKLTEEEWIEVWARMTSTRPDAPSRRAAVVSQVCMPSSQWMSGRILYPVESTQ